MDYTCANCKHRRNWSCEDYHEGELSTRICNSDGFDLDVETLPESTLELLEKLAMALGEVE